MNIKNIALIPDRFAHYRLPIFQKLSDRKLNHFELTIYADQNEDIKGIRIANSSYANTDLDKGGVVWRKIRNFTFRNICFWQSKVSFLPIKNTFDAYVYWGEANRISTWLSCLMAKLFGRKIIFWSHGIYGNENNIKLNIRKLFYSLADAHLLYSDYGKSQMIKNGFDKNKVFVIKNSLDVEYQNSLYERLIKKSLKKEEPLFDSDSKVLLFVGRLEPKKQIHLLIKALFKLRKDTSDNYKLLIVGDGSSEESLKNLVREYNLCDHIIFYGACYDDGILASIFSYADLCVSPGNVGLLAMHSLIYGTPVITHDEFSLQMPEFEVIQPNISGDYFRFNDIDNMIEKIIKVMGLIGQGTISESSCRREILGTYNTDYQHKVFHGMLEYLNQS